MSRDDENSWRYGGVKRRDVRDARGEVRAPKGNKKNTKKWCRGVTGREHIYEEFKKKYEFWTSGGVKKIIYSKLRYRKCKACGKEEWVLRRKAK